MSQFFKKSSEKVDFASKMVAVFKKLHVTSFQCTISLELPTVAVAVTAGSRLLLLHKTREQGTYYFVGTARQSTVVTSSVWSPDCRLL